MNGKMARTNLLTQVLFTKRLELKHLDATDENALLLFDLINRNRMNEYGLFGYMDNIKTQSDALDHLKKEERSFKEQSYFSYYLFLKGKPACIGYIFMLGDEEKAMHPTAFIDKKYEGCGLMREAMQCVEEQLKQNGIYKIRGVYEESNKSSAGLLKRLGYQTSSDKNDFGWVYVAKNLRTKQGK